MTNMDTAMMAAAKRVYDRTWEVSYSFTRFGAWQWMQSVVGLLAAGFTELEAEAILRSKWTRWAADEAGASEGEATWAHLEAFMANPRNRRICSREALARIVDETAAA